VNARGREIGYNILAECDQDDCDRPIDRGLAFVCGGMHDGGDHGCGGYFCSRHLFFSSIDTRYVPLCAACTEGRTL
jgi:hypothetical protein